MIMVNEAMLCLQEGILNTPRDGDLGAILGSAFPPFLGGPFRYVDGLGIPAAVERFGELESRHGTRFRAAQILRDKAQAGSTFY